jgi:hypothetical protein
MKKRLTCLLLLSVVGLLPLLGENSPSRSEGDPPVKKKKTGRAFIEMGGLMAYSTVSYWSIYTKFIEDWQFQLTWKDQKRKFFSSEGLRLDSNAFKSNWTHGLSGAVYYSFARSNGLNSRESFLFSLGGSLFWEYFSEWREVSSINDHFFTSFGGPAIGEPLVQISSYFSGKTGFWNRAAEVFFNPVQALNGLLDGNFRKSRHSGYPEPWHQFNFLVGPERGRLSTDDQGYTRTNLGLQMRLITVPEYGKPGEFSEFRNDTLSSDLFFDISFGSREMEEFNAATKATLFGYWWQRITDTPGRGLSGYSLSLGASSGFDLMKKKALVWYDASEGGLSDPRFSRPTPTEFNDKLAVISPIGPSVDLTIFSPRSRLRWNADAFFDFALVNSLPLDQYSATHDLTGAKTTVLSWGYYYALGYTLSSSVEFDSGQWQWQGSAKYQHYNSIQGHDRFQEIITEDFKLADTRLIYRASIGYRLRRTPLGFRIGFQGIERYGAIGEVSRRNRENRWYYQLSLGF